MDKKILSEINRSREIMGLGQLIREQMLLSSEQIETWFRGDGSEKMGSIRNLVKNISIGNLASDDIDGQSVWEALNDAFKNITGKPIVVCDDMETGNVGCEGTKAAFGKGQWSSTFTQDEFVQRYSHTQTSKQLKKKYALVYNQEAGGEPTVIVNSSELGYNKEEVALGVLCYDINTFNVKNAGREQIHMAGPHARYEKQDGANVLLTKKIEDAVYLWTYTRKSIGRNVVDDKTIEGKAIAGEVLNRQFGDSYENLQIVISDDTEVLEMKQKIAQHTKNGGTIDSITITSTASNTGLQDSAKADFATKMNKAGFSEYANVSNIKGNEGEFTIDEVDTTDEALAVARGTLLARALGVEDKANYKFAITSGAKVVSVSVQGTSPDTKGDDIKIKGSSKTTEKSGQVAQTDGLMVLPVLKINISKRGFFGKVGDTIGTSTGAKRRKQV